MRLVKKLEQNRNDFRGVYQCEKCGAIHIDQILCDSYDDANFYENVIPAMKCAFCDKLSKGDQYETALHTIAWIETPNDISTRDVQRFSKVRWVYHNGAFNYFSITFSYEKIFGFVEFTHDGIRVRDFNSIVNCEPSLATTINDFIDSTRDDLAKYWAKNKAAETTVTD